MAGTGRPNVEGSLCPVPPRSSQFTYANNFWNELPTATFKVLGAGEIPPTRKVVFVLMLILTEVTKLSEYEIVYLNKTASSH